VTPRPPGPAEETISGITPGLRAEVLFRALLEAAPDAMVISGTNGAIQLVNAQTERMFGYRRDELVGRLVEVLVPHPSHDGHAELRAQYASKPLPRGMGSGLGLYGRRQDGSEFPVEVSLSPLATDVGPLVLAAVRDVSDRKRAEEAAATAVAREMAAHKRAEARFRALLESSPDAIVIVGGDGAIQLVNARTEQLFGFDRDELVGQPVEILVPESLRGPHEKYRAAYSDRPHVRMGPDLELRARRRNGSEFPAEISLGPLDLEGGPVVSATIRDITERKRVVEKLAAQSAELSRSNADLEQFAYVASHDLQEPLRHVSVYVQKLAQGYQDVVDERGRRYIRYIVDGATRMQQLTDGLLEFSRVGRSGRQLRPVDLNPVVAAAVRAVSVRAAQAQVVISLPELPHVVGDEDMLYRLFVNLLANAVKFGRADRPPEVGISARTGAPGWWEITVHDNGIGIPAEYRDAVFGLFERVHGHAYPGTGIGLSVARRIVEAHGGTIGLDEPAGGGTRVTFSLPGLDRSPVPGP
jgi:PAS domain S-box-containing protein